jgi:hypothetical protein
MATGFFATAANVQELSVLPKLVESAPVGTAVEGHNYCSVTLSGRN